MSFYHEEYVVKEMNANVEDVNPTCHELIVWVLNKACVAHHERKVATEKEVIDELYPVFGLLLVWFLKT